MRALLPAVLSPLLFGCVVGEDAKSIGRFEVQAELVESCGQDTYLAAPEAYGFQVFLRRSGGSSLLWDDGSNRLLYDLDATSGAFGGSTMIQVDLRNAPQDLTAYGLEPEDFLDGDPFDEETPADDTTPPCVIQRVARVEGVLDETTSAAGTTIRGFEGTLSYRYDATDSSDCSDFLELPVPLASSLPCEVRYALDAAAKR